MTPSFSPPPLVARPASPSGSPPAGSDAEATGPVFNADSPTYCTTPPPHADVFAAYGTPPPQAPQPSDGEVVRWTLVFLAEMALVVLENDGGSRHALSMLDTCYEACAWPPVRTVNVHVVGRPNGRLRNVARAVTKLRSYKGPSGTAFFIQCGGSSTIDALSEAMRIPRAPRGGRRGRHQPRTYNLVRISAMVAPKRDDAFVGRLWAAVRRVLVCGGCVVGVLYGGDYSLSEHMRDAASEHALVPVVWQDVVGFLEAAWGAWREDDGGGVDDEGVRSTAMVAHHVVGTMGLSAPSVLPSGFTSVFIMMAV